MMGLSLEPVLVRSRGVVAALFAEPFAAPEYADETLDLTPYEIDDVPLVYRSFDYGAPVTDWPSTIAFWSLAAYSLFVGVRVLLHGLGRI